MAQSIRIPPRLERECPGPLRITPGTVRSGPGAIRKEPFAVRPDLLAVAPRFHNVAPIDAAVGPAKHLPMVAVTALAIGRVDSHVRRPFGSVLVDPLARFWIVTELRRLKDPTGGYRLLNRKQKK